MKRVLLLGAGFTRNWGGWLASELIGELCGRLQDDVELLQRLKQKRNFEDVLGEVRQEANRGHIHQQRFERLQQAVLMTFDEMNQVLAKQSFEFYPRNPATWVTTFLAEFDAIFTLNQDLFLELHYSAQHAIDSERRWRSSNYPGIALPGDWFARVPEGRLGQELVETKIVENDSNVQPIYKLHGSVNWRTADGSPIVVIGSGKGGLIGRSSLLSTYLETFRKYLSAGQTKLMVIGYSFADDHVNDLLTEASEQKGLQTYLVDPAGLAVFDRPANELITVPKKVFGALRLAGILTRPFRDVFEGDELAFNSFRRFLSDNR